MASSDNTTTKWRDVYNRQPVRMLIIRHDDIIDQSMTPSLSVGRNQSRSQGAGDYAGDVEVIMSSAVKRMDVSTLSNIVDALTNVLALSFSLRGSPRIPAFGLMSLTAETRQLRTVLPLTHYLHMTNGTQSASNLATELFTTLDAFKNSANSTSSNDAVSSCDEANNKDDKGAGETMMKQAIEESVHQFRKLCQTESNKLSSNKQHNQLQIIILSCQSERSLIKETETFLSLLETSNIEKIQLVSLRSVHSILPVSKDTNTSIERPNSEQSDYTHTQESDSNMLLNSLVEVVSLPSDPYALESFFKAWLHDYSTHTEHLHLILQSDDNDDTVIVKCDMFERMLNPHGLPFSGSLFLTTDAVYHQMDTPNQTKTSKGKLLLYQLEMIALVERKGLCESVFFEMPLVLIPTRCWKLDWEELEANQQRFAALCHLLMERNLVILARRRNCLPSHSATNMRQDRSPEGYFIITASRASLLVRSACTRELIMPNVSSTLFEHTSTVPPDILSNMSIKLNRLSVLKTYNPATVSSNLYVQLKQSHVNKMPHRSMLGSGAAAAFGVPSTSSSSRDGTHFRFANKPSTIYQKPNKKQSKQSQKNPLENVTKLTKLSTLLNSHFPDN